jgi:hypothetical protein
VLWNEQPTLGEGLAGRITAFGTGTDLDVVEARSVYPLADLGRDGSYLMMVSKIIQSHISAEPLATLQNTTMNIFWTS